MSWQQPPGPDPVYTAQGFQPGRDYYSPLPFEHLDTVSGNILLKFTDLTLPGNAGFNLSFIRSINLTSSPYGVPEAGEGNPPFPTPWGLEGLPLVVRRTAPQYKLETFDPQLYWMPSFETADGGKHITHWFEPNSYGNGNVLMTRDFWRYTVSTRELEFPNGLKAKYDKLVERGTSGYFNGFLTSVTDPFGNTVTLDWTGDRLVKVTQIVNPDPNDTQVREVHLSYALGAPTLPTVAHPISMTEGGRTWTYVFDAATGTLSEVQPPVGPSWFYGGSPFTVTTPHGGRVKYEFGTFLLYRGKLSERETYPFVNRTMPNRRITEDKNEVGSYVQTGEWTYNWEDSTVWASHLTITGPVRTIIYETEWRTSGPIPKKRTVESSGTPLETETLSYEDRAIFADPGGLGWGSIPLVTSRVVARGTKIYTTGYQYSADNYADFGNPNQISQVGDLSRSTTISYQHAFTPYIRARVASATLSVNGGQEYTREYTYDPQNGFVTSRSSYGVVATYGKDAHGNVSSVHNANGNETTFTYAWGANKNVVTPEFAITREINNDGTAEREVRRGLTTRFEYDPSGRLTRVLPTFGDHLTTSYDNTGGRWVTTSKNATFFTKTWLDGFGRTIETEDAAGIKTQVSYDAEGRRTYKSYPFEGASGVGDVFDYDPLNRLTKVTHPDQSFVEIVNLPNGDVRIIDELAHQPNDPNNLRRETTQHWEAFGDPEDRRLASVTDPRDQIWGYEYTGLGALTKVNGPDDIPDRTWLYNTKHQLESETHPESGQTSYWYDLGGRLVTKRDARLTEFEYTYDTNDRLKKISTAVGEADDVQFWYDASDNRTRMRNASADVTVRV